MILVEIGCVLAFCFTILEPTINETGQSHCTEPNTFVPSASQIVHLYETGSLSKNASNPLLYPITPENHTILVVSRTSDVWGKYWLFTILNATATVAERSFENWKRRVMCIRPSPLAKLNNQMVDILALVTSSVFVLILLWVFVVITIYTWWQRRH